MAHQSNDCERSKRRASNGNLLSGLSAPFLVWAVLVGCHSAHSSQTVPADTHSTELPPHEMRNKPGNQIGELSLETVGLDENGNTISLHDFRGSVVLVDVWATW